MKYLRKITYIKQSKKRNSLLYDIYLKIQDDFTSVTISTKRSISKERWDSTRKLKSPRTIDEKRTASDLERLSVRIDDICLLLQSSGVNPTPSVVKERLNDNNLKYSVQSVFDLFITKFETKVNAGIRSYRTLEKYKKIQSFFTDFLKLNYRVTDMPLINLDYSICESYVDYLRDVKGNCHNTIVKHIWNLKGIWNFAIMYGHLGNDPWSKFSETLEKVETIFLNEDELERIEKLDLKTNPKLDVVRDYFLLTAYTSYSYCDVVDLKINQLEKRDDKNLWINHDRQKTRIQSDIIVLPKALKLINKYSNHPDRIKEGRILPRRSNAKINAYLKEIAVLVGINKRLTHNVARHTFATTTCLLNGISIEVLSRIMGHTNITQTQHYAKVVDKQISKEFKKLL